MGLISLFSSTAALAYQMPLKSEELIYEGKNIVELDLRRTQTRQNFANTSRIHEDGSLPFSSYPSS